MSTFRMRKPRVLAFFALESGLIVGVLYALAYLTLNFNPLMLEQDLAFSIYGTGVLFIGCLVSTRLANLGDDLNFRRELVIFSAVSFVIGLVSFAAVWAVSGKLSLPAFLVLEGAVAVPTSVALWRWLALRYEVYALRERVLIVGSGESAKQTCRWINDSHADEYQIVGFAAETEAQLGQALTQGSRVTSTFATMPDFCDANVDRIIVALDEKRGKLPIKELLDLRLRGVEVEESTSFFERNSGKICVETLLPSWLIFGEGFKTSKVRSALKRVVDVLQAGALLLVAWPVMLVTALAIKVESPGPVLYRQRRMGLNGREFDVLKFRSMVQDAEKKSGPQWAQQNDPRVTRVGRFIRKVRIDELPQLINVFKGDMSFVGPRPERRHFVEQLEEKIPFYGLRMTVRPGVTGWAQVEYRYGSTEEDALEKLKYDLYYIKNNNLMLDLWIVLKTVKVVLLGGGQ